MLLKEAIELVTKLPRDPERISHKGVEVLRISFHLQYYFLATLYVEFQYFTTSLFSSTD